MRKLLLNSTAIATVAALTASVAVADVSISASTEFKHSSRSSSLLAANDGTETNADSEIKFSFSNKTDNGLTVGYVVELESDDTNTAINESSFTISGGFGKVMLGENDGVSEGFDIVAQDLIAEETSPGVASSSISTSTANAAMSGDAIKVSYYIPAMGGFTAGVSYANSGNTGATDTTEYGASYTMDAGGTAVTVAASSATTDATTKDTDTQNMGIKVVSGNLSVSASQGSYEAVGEDRTSQGIAASYKMANGMVVGAYSFKSEDDIDVGEEYTKSGAEVQYTIASGLTAVLTVDDYKYTQATASSDTGSDSGGVTSVTIKASF